jgi:exopolysaccharide production protein ExoZ
MNLTRSLSPIYEVESASASRVLTMEGARGLAVLLVFFVHYRAGFRQWTSGLTYSISEFLWTIGHTGVDLFFVLSGYLIYAAIMKPGTDYAGFLRRRMQRIYPPFLAVFAIYLALSFVFPAQSKLPPDVRSGALYLIQNLLLLPGIFPMEPFIAVTWSLSYEFFYYLTLPVLVLGLQMTRWQRRHRVAFFIALAVAFVASWTIAPFRPRLLMFIAGILLYELVQSSSREPLARRVEWTIVATTVAAFGAMFAVDRLPHGESYRTLIAFFAFIPLVFACFRPSPGGPLERVLAWTPMRWLGNMSYSYYLIHALAIQAIMLVVHREAFAPYTGPALYWALMPFVFLATLVAATVLFVLVEKPLSLTRRTRVAAPAARLAVS